MSSSQVLVAYERCQSVVRCLTVVSGVARGGECARTMHAHGVSAAVLVQAGLGGPMELQVAELEAVDLAARQSHFSAGLVDAAVSPPSLTSVEHGSLLAAVFASHALDPRALFCVGCAIKALLGTPPTYLPFPLLASAVAAPFDLPAAPATVSPERRVRRVLEGMKGGDTAELGRSEQQWGDVLGITPAHVGRLVQRHTGLGFREVRRIFRMRQAVQLLRTTEDHAAQVAYRVGFDDPSHFSRECRDFFGLPPKALRRVIRRSGPMDAPW